MKRTNSLSKFLGLMLAVVAVSAVAVAKEPDATLTLDTTSIAAGVGATWGKGKLHFKGRTYPFSAQGVSIVDVGIATSQAAGNVFSLNRVEDFAGTYNAAKGEVALGGGVGGLMMKNEKGVIVNLTSTKQGLKLAVGPEGLKIKLE